MRLPRKLALLLVCAFLAASGLQSVPVAAPLPSSIAAAQDEDREFVIVRQRSKSFDPPVVVIHEGDTVVWVNETAGGWHDVQSYEGEFSSERMVWGDTFVRTFDQSGVYGYFCSPHVIDGMQGAVVVLPKGAPLPDPLPSPSVPAASTFSAEQDALGIPDTIATVAGGGGNGGSATEASLYLPEGIALDDVGRLYIADTENCQVRRVDRTGIIVSILGHESCGYSMGGDADLGPWLHTNHPRGVAVGPDGAVYVADTINCRVRSVNQEGVVATIAGSGSCRASGDGGPAVEAGLSPWGLTFDGEGNLYLADVFNCRIRKVDGDGVIETVAGDGRCGYSGDGGPARQASLFFPRNVAVDTDGALYIADTGNCRVRRVLPATGIIETVAGRGDCSFAGDGAPASQAGLHPWALAISPDGGVLVADRENCRLRRFIPGGLIDSLAGTGECAASSDGGAAAASALYWPSDVTIGPEGAIYVADTATCRVRRIDEDGRIATVAGSGVCAAGGDGGAATAGGAWHPMGLAMGVHGDWYFSELDTCRVRRIDARGVVTTYAGTGECGFSGDGGPATQAHLSDMLGGLALADDGSLFIAEGYNCRVRRVDPDGIIETVGGNGECGFSGDGGPASKANLGFVSDVALDGSGGLFVAGPFNCRVRRIDLADKAIETVVGDGSCDYNGEEMPALAAGLEPWGVAVGSDGALYVADSGNCRVRRVGHDGLITTVAGGGACGYGGDGGPAVEAQLLRPYDVVLDQDGNLYVADLRTFTVRKVDRGGIISTVAGIGIARPVDIGGFDPTGGVFCSTHSLPVPAPSYLADGGSASQAGLYFPYAIALGHDGDLYIADTFDHRVRRVMCGGSVPCAGPATPTASAVSEEMPAAVSQLPSTGQPARSAGAAPVVGLLAGIGTALLLLAANVVRAGVRRNR